MPASSSSNRRAQQRAQQRTRQHTRHPGLLERVRGLQGRTRFIVLGAIILAVIGLFVATGGTTYALQLEEHDQFCASCHTQPEVQYYGQSLEKDSLTLAAFHSQKNVRCIECHSGGGILGRTGGLSQGAVDALAYYSGNYRHPAVTTSKLGDDSCLKCHADTALNGSFNNHFHRFLSRWQSVDVNAAHCVDCHTAHPAGVASQQYLTVVTVQSQCQACHDVLATR